MANFTNKQNMKLVRFTKITQNQKYLLHFFANLFVLIILSTGIVSGQKTWDRGANTNNWEDANNWNPNGVPLASETVTIGNNYTVVINSAAVCSSLTISNGNRPTSVSINGTNSLSVTNAITIGAAERDNDNKFISVGTGTLTAGTLTMANTTTDARDCNIRVSTGTITISGDITMNGAVARNQLIFTGAGTLNIGGSISGGTISSAIGGYTVVGNGTVNFNGTAAQTIPNNIYNFYNVTVSNTNADGAVFGGNVTATNIINTIRVANGGYMNNTANRTIARGAADAVVVDLGGVFNLGTSSITWGGTTGTATINGTLRTANTTGFSGAVGTAISSTNNPTITLGANSTIEYDAPTGSQIVTSRTYSNLTLSNSSGTQTAGGALTVNGTLTTVSGSTLNMGANQLLGTLSTISNAGTIQTQNTTATPFPTGKTWGGTILYNGSSVQTIPNSTINNLTISNGSGVSLSSPINISGILTLNNGKLTSTPTNLITIANTATNAIVGGSASSFINGPVNWTLPSNLVSGSTYNFPVGSGTTYLPFALVNPTTSGAASAQVEAIVGTSGGTTNVDALLASKSNTEYWSLTTTGSFTDGSVSLTRPTAITPNDVVGASTSLTGTYTSLLGTAGTFAVSNSNPINTNR
jgi:hypothetical protein